MMRLWWNSAAEGHLAALLEETLVEKPGVEGNIHNLGRFSDQPISRVGTSLPPELVGGSLGQPFGRGFFLPTGKGPGTDSVEAALLGTARQSVDSRVLLGQVSSREARFHRRASHFG